MVFLAVGMGQNQRETGKARTLRVRKTTARDRNAIILLYETGLWTMQEIADKWNVTQPRVSQIIHDTYNEKGAVQNALK